MSWSDAFNVDETGVMVFFLLTPVQTGKPGSPTVTLALLLAKKTEVLSPSSTAKCVKYFSSAAQ